MAVVAVDAEDLSAEEDLLQALEPGQACCHDCGQVFKVTELSLAKEGLHRLPPRGAHAVATGTGKTTKSSAAPAACR